MTRGGSLGSGEGVRAMRRGWAWAGFMLGFAARIAGAGALFWAVFPLWLVLFWGVQGYPPTLSDLTRWYALGAFNTAPIVGTVLTSPLVLGVLIWGGARHPSPSSTPPKRLGVGRRAWRMVLGALLYALLVPPLAYALLLVYAKMWQYRAWDAMMPTLLRAYLMLAPACGLTGALVGWTLNHFGAGDGIRTRDPRHGRPMLYP